MKIPKKTLDAILTIGCANVGTLYGASEIIDKNDFSDPTNGAIMLTTGATLGLGNYLLTRSEKNGIFRKIIKSVNNLLDLNRYVSWFKTTAMSVALAASVAGTIPYCSQVYGDISRLTKDDQIEESEETSAGRNSSRARPSIYNRLSYETKIEYDFSDTQLAPKETIIGRVQRTLRWKPIYRAVENAYGIPRDKLGGMICKESYGNPVQPNASNDGGLGVTHVQGTTAKAYGLKIHGSSGRSSDRQHGNQVREMLAGCNYDPVCAQRYDERAHLIKLLDTAARIVTEGRNVHGIWDKGIQYYRCPGKVEKKLTRQYSADVERWRIALSDENVLAQARTDFEDRNGYSLDTYLERWHEMSSNWGLDAYRRAMAGN